jgi:hypothetical protein
MISRLPPEQPSDDGAEELLGIAAAFIECRRQFVRPARRARALQIRLSALETSREPDHGTTTCKPQGSTATTGVRDQFPLVASRWRVERPLLLSLLYLFVPFPYPSMACFQGKRVKSRFLFLGMNRRPIGR